MDEAQFWSIIADSREAALKRRLRPGQDFIELHEQTLAEELRQLQPDQIVAFDDCFWRLHWQAYHWDLWAVAYWLGGGCSDDGFIDFRATLISLGRQNYEAALDDADSLADLVGRPDVPYMQSEGFQYVASKAYQEKTGATEWPRTVHAPRPLAEPGGERFDFDDDEEMERRFPRVVAAFPDGMD